MANTNLDMSPPSSLGLFSHNTHDVWGTLGNPLKRSQCACLPNHLHFLFSFFPFFPFFFFFFLPCVGFFSIRLLFIYLFISTLYARLHVFISFQVPRT